MKASDIGVEAIDIGVEAISAKYGRNVTLNWIGAKARYNECGGLSGSAQVRREY